MQSPRKLLAVIIVAAAIGAVAAFLAVGPVGAASREANRQLHSRKTLVDSGGELVFSGLPAAGMDANGQNDYAKVLDAPARVTHFLFVACEDANAGVTISLDGGSTDHLYLPGGAQHGVVLGGLNIPASAEVHAKNTDANEHYIDLSIAVW